MDEILAVLSGDHAPELTYLTTLPDIEDLAAICRDRELRLFVLDGDQIATKADFLVACAQVMEFPDYFGHNWDAFEDCLTDLSWIPAQGYVLLYQPPQILAETEPGDWAILLEIFQTALDYWFSTPTPLYIFL